MPTAKILSRRTVVATPWCRLRAKRVRLPDGRTAVYHSIDQQDSVAVLARTPGGLIPIIRQFRPTIEAYTWELPAGLLEPGESPRHGCRRELLEEAGVRPERLTYLGAYYTDTGRLEHRMHAFVAHTNEPDRRFKPEAGVAVSFITPAALGRAILSRRFRLQQHIGLLGLATLRGFNWGWWPATIAQ